jgi:hypothetical protein
LYSSALTKGDPDYASQLLLFALVANPEHGDAFAALLDKLPAYAASGRRLVLRIGDSLAGAPADPFIKSLAAYCAAPGVDAALACAAEAVRAGLAPHAAALARRAMQQAEAAATAPRIAWLNQLIDLFESAGALGDAVRAARWTVKLFPDDASAREREKNLLASQYLKDTNIARSGDFRDLLRDRRGQEAMHRPTDQAGRLDALEQRYRQTHAMEDFRELVRALREAPAPRKEAAEPTLRDGLERFGDRETLWFVREIRLDRKWAELRLHRQVVDESPEDAPVRAEHERVRQEVLREHVEHLYEVVSALPAGTPERLRRELELTARLFDAGRYEESIKQAQAVKRRAENRLDALLLMAKAFVQLGLRPEASASFEAILAELDAGPGRSSERALEAKYSYAEFLTAEAERKQDLLLARQARKLCSDVMIEDIDYRATRDLAARADRLIVQVERQPPSGGH